MKDRYAKPWVALATRWKKYYRPPGQPSPSAIHTYERFARQAFRGLHRKPRTLVLGATPELRDITARLKTDAVMIDVNVEMIQAMTSLLKEKNPDEVIVRGDWCAMPFHDGYFDAVFGDIVIENVPHSLKDQCLREVRRVLRPHGYFIQKMAVIPDNWPYPSFEEVVEKYRSVSPTKQHAIEFFAHLHNVVFDPKRKRINTADIQKALLPWWRGARYQHPSKNVTHFMNHLWMMWQPFQKVWDINSECDERRLVSRYFTIRNEVVLRDCIYHENDATFPIWFCQKK